MAARTLLRDDADAIEAQLRAWIADPAVDVVVTTGGTGITGRDVTPEAFERVVEKRIEGFGELFRMLSYARIGTSTMQSRAMGGVAGGTYLFALPGNRIAAIDFGIMGRIDRRARVWLAEILYGLITGNYKRVAEIHFEAGYVPAHHDVAEFATALRAVGEPMRGLPVKDMSIGMMLDSLFSITRDFDMVTQPHLLLLQKTMVMEEGVALSLDPDINMFDAAGPLVADWMRTELGPEARLADRLVRDFRTLAGLPELLRRVEALVPVPGGAPPLPPLPELKVAVKGGRPLSYVATALIAAAAGVGGALLLG